MIEKYILNIGLNDKNTKKQELKTADALKIIKKTLFNNGVEGYTIYNGFGLYKHDNGAITQEKTVIIEFIYIQESLIDKIIELLKKELNQESILKQKQELKIEFI